MQMDHQRGDRKTANDKKDQPGDIADAQGMVTGDDCGEPVL